MLCQVGIVYDLGYELRTPRRKRLVGITEDKRGKSPIWRAVRYMDGDRYLGPVRSSAESAADDSDAIEVFLRGVSGRCNSREGAPPANILIHDGDGQWSSYRVDGFSCSVIQSHPR